MIDGQLTDLTLGEIRSVLATIAGIDPADVRDWMIVIEQPHECGDPDCEAGKLAVLNGRAGEHEAPGNANSLRLASEVVRSIAARMADGDAG